MTLGQEFSGYRELIRKNIKRIKNDISFINVLTLGGTAVGTGINTHRDFIKN